MIQFITRFFYSYITKNTMPFQTNPQSPEHFPLITYFWVLAISMLGGFVSFMRKLKDKRVRAWNVAEFAGELATSAFSGVMTFYLCQWSGFSGVLTAALVGISGHMGSRAIFVMEKFFESKFPMQGTTNEHRDKT